MNGDLTRELARLGFVCGGSENSSKSDPSCCDLNLSCIDLNLRINFLNSQKEGRLCTIVICGKVNYLPHSITEWMGEGKWIHLLDSLPPQMPDLLPQERNGRTR